MAVETGPRLIQEALDWEAKKAALKPGEDRRSQTLELWERARSLLVASGVVQIRKASPLTSFFRVLRPTQRGEIKLALGEKGRSVDVSIEGVEYFSSPGSEFTEPVIEIKVGELRLSLAPRRYYKPEGVWDIPDSETLGKYAELLTAIENKLGIDREAPQGQSARSWRTYGVTGGSGGG